jgi:ABC-type multidrug transport system ATPase subunit
MSALDNVSLKMNFGNRVALLGQNGSGKSTLFKQLALEARPPTSGSLFIRRLSVLWRRWGILNSRSIGYVPQTRGLMEFLTVGEAFKIFAALKGFTCSVESKSLIHPKYAAYPTNFLSGGNKKKLAVALAFCGSFPLILLDEVTSGIDPVSAERIVQFVKDTDPSVGVVFSSHRMDECLTLCSRVVVLHRGSVIYDGPADAFGSFTQLYIQVDIFIKSIDKRELIEAAFESSGYSSSILRVLTYDTTMMRMTFLRRIIPFSVMWDVFSGNSTNILHPYSCTCG